MDEYQEFVLTASASETPHHVMKLNSTKHSLESLTHPLSLSRLERPKEVAMTDDKKAWFKKKSKQFFLGREDRDEVIGGGEIKEGSMISSVGSRRNDPDKAPWILKDAEHITYTGKVEGSQTASYCLLVANESGGFDVVNVGKWYKFGLNSTHRTLTLEEAEEKTKTQNKLNDRWLMKELDKGQGKDKAVKMEPKVKNVDLDETGMDFEQGFSDDEDVNLGIEDKDEAKEAEKRAFDGASNNQVSESGKKIAKSLVKREQMDVYEEEPDNPYWSDEEEEEEAEEVKPTNLLLENAKRRVKTVNRGASPHQSQPTEPTAKRIKIDPDTLSTPPPPSAAEVVKKLSRKGKSSSRNPSTSPAPEVIDEPLEADDLQMEDLVNVIKSKENITVREVVAALRPWLLKSSNKTRMKKFMSVGCNHNKITGVMTLKDL